MRHPCPSENKRAQGRPGAGRTHGPPANKKAGGSHHRFGRTSGLPCATVLTVSFALPGEPGFLAPIARELRKPTNLTQASGCQDHATSPSALHRSSHDATRPSHPALHVRDDASAPPGERGTTQDNHIFLKNERGIFFAGGLDRRISVEFPREIRPCAHPFLRNSGALKDAQPSLGLVRFWTWDQEARDLRNCCEAQASSQNLHVTAILRRPD